MTPNTSIAFGRNLLRLGLVWPAVAGAACLFGGPAPAGAAVAVLSGAGFTFHLRGQPNGTYAIQTSPDLVNWTATATNQADPTGAIAFTDEQAGSFGQRFYRGVRLAVAATSGRSDRLLVKPKPSVALGTLHLTLGVELTETFPAIGNLQVVQLADPGTADATIAAYRQSGLVEYVERDYVVHALAEPDDFRFRDGSLWNLMNSGQLDGALDADIDAPEAWDVITSASSSIVAVIDTGVRTTHEDLAANLWTNPGEIPDNGLDDDGNGYVDDVHGINALDNSGRPEDDYGHGSHVSGILGAVGNNQVGVVGVCWQVRIMACKFLDAHGDGSIADAIACIDYARAKGAKVINASWGSTNFTSRALQDAIASARDAGIIFVAACGNSSGNNDDPASAIFPASYDLANIIAVAATTRADGLAGFSNYGATTVDLAAPGIPVFSCWNDADDAYQYFAGTSMAAAHVSGACALTLALHPDENYQRIIERILGGVDKVPGLAGKCATGGRLNLQKALGGSPPPPKPTITVAVSEANASESGNSGAFAISRVGSNTSALTVNYVMNGTAQNGGDYENLPGSATISAGSTSATVPLRPIDDGAVEGPETVVLTLLPDAAYTVGSPDRATMTLTDNDQPPAAPVAGFTANPTSGQAPLGVQFVNESTGNVTSWDWNFGDGTAHSLVPNPYHNYSSAGTFTATLTVSGPGGSSSRNTTIQVSSPPPPEPSTLTVTAGDAVASESGDPGAFTIRRSGGTGSALLVNYTLDGTAAGGADYQDLSGSVTFPQGADSATVIVRPVDDFTDEGSETVVLALAGSPAYVVGTPASATVIITDNDQTPDTRPYVSAIAIKPDASESGAGGLITIVRTGGAATALTVSYTLGGNARNGVDYQPLSGSVTIPAGASSADVVIIPIDDQGEEIDEPVYLMLAPGAGYIVGRPNAVTVMIADNDQQPTRATVTVVATDPNASESGDSGVFTISRTGSTASALTVNYTLGGNGQNGVDYQTIGLTVTIPAGADSATVTIRPLEDAGREIDEPVYLMLAPGAGYIVGKPDAATVILADND